MKVFTPLPLALLAWLCVWAILAACLPLLPVDETRYLTVAMEMRQSGDWLLPTLNHAPYSHKPPLLFWLINIVWTVAGENVAAARIVSFMTSTATVLLTAAFAKKLYPENKTASETAPLLLMASPAFMIYGGLIMFDFLMTVFILLALMALWKALRDGPSLKTWALFGLATGGAVLAKGPIVLVHVLPVALAGPWIAGHERKFPKGSWYAGLAAGIGIATTVGLSWAIPAALSGGEEFARMIFWEQSAGRMVQAFDHKRPFWFYLPFALAFTLPALLYPPVRRALKQTTGVRERFLLFWICSSFLLLCLISGKQPHYLLPLLPGFFLLAGKADRGNGKDILPPSIFFGIMFTAILAAPFLAGLKPDDRIFSQGLAAFTPLPGVAFMIAAGAALIFAFKKPDRQPLCLVLATAALIALVPLQASKSLFSFLDLRPLAAALQSHRDKPIAFVRKYAGEMGFLARLDHPVEGMDRGELRQWFEDHPDGVAILRFRDRKDLKNYTVLFEQPYRADQYYALVIPAPRPAPSP